MAFVAVNNGLTGLLGGNTQEPRGRHADPEAGGYPALCPAGDRRSVLPGTSLQVSMALCRHSPSGFWLGFFWVSLIIHKRHWCCTFHCLLPASAPTRLHLGAFLPTGGQSKAALETGRGVQVTTGPLTAAQHTPTQQTSWCPLACRHMALPTPPSSRALPRRVSRFLTYEDPRAHSTPPQPHLNEFSLPRPSFQVRSSSEV